MQTYYKDTELPAIPVRWEDDDGTAIDFSTGWTFTAKVALTTAPFTSVLTKTTNITGAATFPNVTIDWTTTDFSALTADESGTQYVVHLIARRTADSKDRPFKPGRSPIQFSLYPAVA